MSDNATESELKQRRGTEENTEEVTSDAAKEITTEIVEKSTWQTVKYYFNRFRYYHFVVADTVDKYLSAACLLIIKWYFKLFLGVGEPESTLTQVD